MFAASQKSLERNLFTIIISFYNTHQLNPLEQRKSNLDISFYESFDFQNQHSKVEFNEWISDVFYKNKFIMDIFILILIHFERKMLEDMK